MKISEINRAFEHRDFVGGPASDEEKDFIDFDRLLAVVRRQWRVVALSAFVLFSLGIVYILMAVPQYTASTSVFMDRGNGQLMDQLSNMGSQQAGRESFDEESIVLSEVELLKSKTIAFSVIKRLNLTQDQTFTGPQGSLIRGTINAVTSLFRKAPTGDLTDQDAVNNATAILQQNIDVTRVGRSYVLNIAYTSRSPELAARIATAIADSYLTDKLDSKYDASRRAGAWLQDRIEELRKKSLESDLAVQKFRAANGLVMTNKNGQQQLATDQQLSELNTALISAQGDTARAQARYERIKQIMAAGQSDAIVTDVLGSSISNDLRKKFLDASKMEAEISSRLGRDHIQAVRLRGEMSEYKRLMFEELSRIAQSYQSELDVAKSREQSLDDSVAAATGVSSLANETQVQLRELDRASETYRNLYQTFLQRYQETIQQQSFPITEARIISPASVPSTPSKPRKALTLALSIVLGCAIGSALGTFREFRDRFFRTGEQVRDSLGMEFLGTTPLIVDRARSDQNSDDQLHPRAMRKTNILSNYVLDHSLSSFAETLRSAKIAADLGITGKKTRVIGIVSTLPGEGKSSIAVNFAELLASQGSKTLLIDADLRNPGATRALGRHAEDGLLEAVLEHKPVNDLLLVNQESNLAFLPAVVKHRIAHSSELLSSAAMQKIITNAGADFNYIVLDLPPLGPVVDARAVAPLVDGFLYVVEWGKTSRKVVRQTLENEPQIAAKCLGVILNKVDVAKMKLYRMHGSSEFYESRYAAYYREA